MKDENTIAMPDFFSISYNLFRLRRTKGFFKKQKGGRDSD